MTDPLPPGAFTALPPPPAGAAAAVRGGRRLRRKRRATNAGAALAVAAVVAGAFLVTGNTGPHASDTLVPARPGPPATDGQVGTRPDDGSALGVASGRPVSAAAPTPRPSASGRPAARPTPAAAAPDRSPTVTGYRTPELVRRYHPALPQGGGPSGRICGGGGEGDTNGNLSNGYGFCVAAYATSTNRGHDLVLEVCRDSTGPGTLRFTRELEAELVVHDALDKDRVVWRWSPGHSNDQNTHTLSVETNACWTWTAPWTDVDARGHDLDTGSYEVGVVSRADQLRAMPEQRAAFRVS